jgi:hypothetical protein
MSNEETPEYNNPGVSSVITPSAGLGRDTGTRDNVAITPSTPLLQETSSITTAVELDTQILKMNTSAVDFLRMLGQVPNDDGRFERDVDTFLQQTNVIDFMDFTDLSQTPYDKFTQFVDAETFHRLVPFIIDMKLLVQYIYDFADFDALLKQAHQKTDSAWAKVMDDEKEHTRRFKQYRSTYHDDEYEIYRESLENDGTHSIVGSIASRKSRGSHGIGKHTRPGERTRTTTAIKDDEISIASTIRSKRAEHEAKESRRNDGMDRTKLFSYSRNNTRRTSLRHNRITQQTPISEDHSLRKTKITPTCVESTR